MDSYIIRIYQRDADSLTGVVESTENGGQGWAFHNPGELWQILVTNHTGDAGRRQETQDSSETE
jgi:hypothetical protein